MANKDEYFVIRGELNWAKIVGKARPHDGLPKYDKGPYWSVDITPDAASRKLLKKHGVDGKLREPKGQNDKRKESFLTLRILENRSDGEKNDPPAIKDIRGVNWDGSKIGNGSIADIKVKVKDYGSGSDKGLYYQAARILQHVPYERDDFDELSEDDEFFGNTATEAEPQKEPDTKAGSNPDDLDDDIPF